MPKQYADEYKRQVVLVCQNGLPFLEASQKYQVSQSTLYRWLKEVEPIDGQHIAADYNTLQRQHIRLDHQLQIIRLSGIIDDIPLRKWLEILAHLHEQFEQYSVHGLCEALSVARGTFYNHIFRKADRTQDLREQQILMLQVQQIFDDSKQRYGAEKIRVILA